MKSKGWFLRCALIDILAIMAIYFFIYIPTKDVFSAISANASVIRYHSTMYFIFGIIILPAYQLCIVIEAYLPKWSKRHISQWIFYGSIILAIAFGIAMTSKIKHQLTRNGYLYCSAASKQMNISRFSVYVLDEETCHRLSMEKKKR